MTTLSDTIRRVANCPCDLQFKVPQCTLRGLAEALDRPLYKVAVIGLPNEGKTTVASSLLRTPAKYLLDGLVRPIPSSSVLLRLRSGATESATIQFLNGETEEVEAFRVAEFGSEQRNPQNEKHVHSISLSLTGVADELSCLEIIDSPGLEWDREHTAFVIRAIAEADAILLVIRRTLTNSQADYLRASLKNGISNYILVQNAEADMEISDCQRLMEQNKRAMEKLGFDSPNCHLVDPLDVEDEGMKLLRRHLSTCGKYSQEEVQRRLVKRAMCVCGALWKESNDELIAIDSGVSEYQKTRQALEETLRQRQTECSTLCTLVDDRIKQLQGGLTVHISDYFGDSPECGFIRECMADVRKEIGVISRDGWAQASQRFEAAVRNHVTMFWTGTLQQCRDGVEKLAADALEGQVLVLEAGNRFGNNQLKFVAGSAIRPVKVWTVALKAAVREAGCLMGMETRPRQSNLGGTIQWLIGSLASIGGIFKRWTGDIENEFVTQLTLQSRDFRELALSQIPILLQDCVEYGAAIKRLMSSQVVAIEKRLQRHVSGDISGRPGRDELATLNQCCLVTTRELAQWLKRHDPKEFSRLKELELKELLLGMV